MTTDLVREIMLPDPPKWHDKAACRNSSLDIFFPDPGDTAREARKVCIHCPVREECLDYAIKHNIKHGIWGGFTERQRSKIKRGGRRKLNRL